MKLIEKERRKKKTTWMNVSLVCLFRGVNLWNIPATMIIFRVNKWILLYYNVVNMNFHYWMIIVAEMFHKLTPGNRQTSETFIQFVWFFSSLFLMHQQGTNLTQNWLLCTFFMLQAFSVFFVGTAFFPQVFVKCATKIDREGLETTKLFFVTS